MKQVRVIAGLAMVLLFASALSCLAADLPTRWTDWAKAGRHDVNYRSKCLKIDEATR